jgi:hypothetical protein
MVVRFLAVGFRKKQAAVHVYLTYTPQVFLGKGYARELKGRFFAPVKKQTWEDDSPSRSSSLISVPMDSGSKVN